MCCHGNTASGCTAETPFLPCGALAAMFCSAQSCCTWSKVNKGAGWGRLRERTLVARGETMLSSIPLYSLSPIKCLNSGFPEMSAGHEADTFV